MSDICAGASPDILAALHRAWPGIQVRQLQFSTFDQQPGERDPYGCNGFLTVKLDVFGSCEALVAQAVVTAAELEEVTAAGNIRRCHFAVSRRKSGYRVEHYLSERCEANGSLDASQAARSRRLRDVMAMALMPQIWQPPARSAA